MKHQEMLDRAVNAFRVNDYEVAGRLTSELLSAYPDLTAAHILLGTIYGHQKRYGPAIESFEKAIALEPHNAQALNNLAVIYRQTGDADRALQLVQAALRRDPNNAEIFYNLGNIHKDRGQHQEAIDAYEQAVARQPDLAVAYNNMGTLYDSIGDHDKAARAFERGLKQDANHPRLHYNLGNTLQSLGRLDDAVHSYEAARRSRPGWADALNNLGVVLNRLQRSDEAEQTFRELIELQPENHTALNNLGTVLAGAGRVDEALEAFQTALSNAPRYTRAVSNLGQVAAQATDPQIGRQILQDLVQRDPDNLALRRALATALTRSGLHQAAVEQWKLVVDADPADAEAVRELGLAYYRLGDRANGERQLAKYQSLRPDDTSYLGEIAHILQDEGRYDEALELAERALAGQPDNVHGLLRKAEILANLGQGEAAKASLAEAAQMNPEDGNLIAARANVHRALGDRDEALAAADELISLQGQRGSADDLSALNRSLELYEDLVTAYEEENAERWQSNLERLGRLTERGRSAPEQFVPMDTEETEDIDEDSIPILNFLGGSVAAEEEEPEPEPELEAHVTVRTEAAEEDEPAAGDTPQQRRAPRGPDPYDALRNIADPRAEMPFAPGIDVPPRPQPEPPPREEPEFTITAALPTGGQGPGEAQMPLPQGPPQPQIPAAQPQGPPLSQQPAPGGPPTGTGQPMQTAPGFGGTEPAGGAPPAGTGAPFGTGDGAAAGQTAGGAAPSGTGVPSGAGDGVSGQAAASSAPPQSDGMTPPAGFGSAASPSNPPLAGSPGALEAAGDQEALQSPSGQAGAPVGVPGQPYAATAADPSEATDAATGEPLAVAVPQPSGVVAGDALTDAEDAAEAVRPAVVAGAAGVPIESEQDEPPADATDSQDGTAADSNRLFDESDESSNEHPDEPAAEQAEAPESVATDTDEPDLGEELEEESDEQIEDDQAEDAESEDVESDVPEYQAESTDDELRAGDARSDKQSDEDAVLPDDREPESADGAASVSSDSADHGAAQADAATEESSSDRSAQHDGAPEAGASDSAADEESTTPSSTRQKLRSMIARANDLLGQPDGNTTPSPHAKLFRYLLGLSRALPTRSAEQFKHDDNRLRLASLARRFSGAPTLRRLAEQSAPPRPPAASPPRLARKTVGDTFGYLASLSKHIEPDDIAQQLQERAERIQHDLDQ